MKDHQTEKDDLTAEDHFQPRMGLRIVSAAVKLRDGRVICGVRHFDKIMRMSLPENTEEGREAIAGHEEGFVTNGYEFASRETAWRIAVMANQINWTVYKGVWGVLFSEDLW